MRKASHQLHPSLKSGRLGLAVVSPSMTDVVNYEAKNRVSIITLNRPEARNAVNQALAEGLEAAIDRLEEDEDQWVGILASTGTVFCAGADLKEVANGNARLGTKRGGFGGFVTLPRTKPVIAAVDGPAVAGGCELALASDMIVASTNASFGLPEVKRCLVAMAGGTARLPKRLPPNIAMEMALTGDTISAERAHHFGLVNVLTEPGKVIEGAMELAERINANAPLAVRATREAVLRGAEVDDLEGIKIASELFRPVAGSEDAKEGPRAFIEKRPPEWTGR